MRPLPWDVLLCQFMPDDGIWILTFASRGYIADFFYILIDKLFFLDFTKSPAFKTPLGPRYPEPGGHERSPPPPLFLLLLLLFLGGRQEEGLKDFCLSLMGICHNTPGMNDLCLTLRKCHLPDTTNKSHLLLSIILGGSRESTNSENTYCSSLLTNCFKDHSLYPVNVIPTKARTRYTLALSQGDSMKSKKKKKYCHVYAKLSMKTSSQCSLNSLQTIQQVNVGFVLFIYFFPLRQSLST